ncbi:superinfection immunity protein [Streptococcus salivarius]|uniref:superinfection immunity protein n=1 Tax=Streptococcus salivarius TaxID=1304 RepID=UPI0018A8CF31|nr:superinfection immunity protein [Streptococcus salivarius]
MKQQDWIDFFQAVNGRNPSIQEMAEAAQKGEFVRETPKQTVEVTETVPQKDTVETAENDVDNYDIAEEPLADTNLEELQDLPNTSPASSQTNATFQHPNHNFNETWTQHESKSQTNLIMIAIASIPVILWALAMILFGIASDELSGGLLTAFLSIIISLPLVVLQILPALLNKTDKKWPIFILSFLLGWTFIGWVIFLVISINTNKEAERIRQQQMMMQMSGKQGSSDMFNPFH